MHYINCIDFFSVQANMCAQISLKYSCPNFDPLTPLTYDLNIIASSLTRSYTKSNSFEVTMLRLIVSM